MNFCVGHDESGKLDVGFVFLTERNLELLREGKPLILEFRLGTLHPFDVRIHYAPTDEQAGAMMGSLTEAPGCKHHHNPLAHPGGSNEITESKRMDWN